MWPVEHADGAGSVARKGAVAQRTMLRAPPRSPRKEKADHQVAQVAIEGVGVRRHQLARAAGGDQGLVELAVVALPEFGLPRAVQHPPLDDVELVVRGDDATLPLHVAGGERLRERVPLEQQPQLGQLAQIPRP